MSVWLLPVQRHASGKRWSEGVPSRLTAICWEAKTLVKASVPGKTRSWDEEDDPEKQSRRLKIVYIIN